MIIWCLTNSGYRQPTQTAGRLPRRRRTRGPPVRSWPVVPAEMINAMAGIDVAADVAIVADRLRHQQT